jgi:hypothetical protein
MENTRNLNLFNLSLNFYRIAASFSRIAPHYKTGLANGFPSNIIESLVNPVAQNTYRPKRR